MYIQIKLEKEKELEAFAIYCICLDTPDIACSLFVNGQPSVNDYQRPPNHRQRRCMWYQEIRQIILRKIRQIILPIKPALLAVIM